MRRLLVRLHRWIGLTSGLVVFVAGVSGAIYVWEQELFALVHPHLVTVPASSSAVSADSLLASARRAMPQGRPVTRMIIYGNPRRAAIAQSQRENPEGRHYFSQLRWFDEVYLDPHTGDVLGVADRKHDWIYLTRNIHTSLLLAQWGEWIVGVATLAFILMCVVGLVLWWPRTRTVLSTRLVPKLGGRWKRTVFDAHNIFGFYGLAGLLIVGITGPVWTWRWYTDAIVWTLTGEARLVSQPVPTPRRTPYWVSQPLETALTSTRTLAPAAQRYLIEVPADDRRVLTVGAVFDRESLWEEYERFYFHPVSATLLGDERFDEKNLGMKWRNSNYGIHTGTLFGWPTQIVATLVSLLAASLPLTGATIWLPRWMRRRSGTRQHAPPKARATDLPT